MSRRFYNKGDTMGKHKCYKETELQKIMDDIAYIKKSICGNGETGLIHDVKENTEFRLQAKGFYTGIIFIATALSAVVIFVIEKIFK